MFLGSLHRGSSHLEGRHRCESFRGSGFTWFREQGLGHTLGPNQDFSRTSLCHMELGSGMAIPSKGLVLRCS